MAVGVPDSTYQNFWTSHSQTATCIQGPPKNGTRGSSGAQSASLGDTCSETTHAHFERGLLSPQDEIIISEIKLRNDKWFEISLAVGEVENVSNPTWQRKDERLLKTTMAGFPVRLHNKIVTMVMIKKDACANVFSTFPLSRRCSNTWTTPATCGRSPIDRRPPSSTRPP